MAYNRGKAFENKFKKDWLATVPGSIIDRIYDTQSGYYQISNICDFIGYKYPNIYYLEVKSVEGGTFPIVNLTQYYKLSEKSGIPGVRSGVVIWFVSFSEVYYVPVKTFTQLKTDGKKSFSLKKHDGYRAVKIPSKEKRLFLDSDYSILTTLGDGD